MGKIIKNVYQRVLIGLDLILLLFFILSFVLQLSVVQTKIAKELASYLSTELSTEVNLTKLRIDFFSKALIKDLYIEDLQGDTMLFSKELELNVDPYELLNLKLKARNLCITYPVVNLKLDTLNHKLNIGFLVDYFSPDIDDSSEIPAFSINHVEISEGTFYYKETGSIGKTGSFNPKNFKIENLNLYFSELSIDSGKIDLYDYYLSLREQTFNLFGLSGDIEIGRKRIAANNMNLKTSNSEIHSNISLSSENWEDYKDFLNKVDIQARFLPSDISMKDVSHFVPDLEGMTDIPAFSGEFSGKVNNIKGRKVRLALSDHTYANLDFKLKGLPNISETFLYLNIKDLHSSKAGLERIKIPPFKEDRHIELPSNFASLGEIDFKGKITGFLKDLTIKGDVKTEIGLIKTDITLSNDEVFAYSGKIKTIDFNAGKFFGTEKILGKVTLFAKIKGSGLEKSTIDASLDGNIESMYFRNYNYKNVLVNGDFNRETFRGKFKVNDPYLKLNFIGSIDLSEDQKEFNFMAEVEDLYPGIILGIEHLDSSAHLSTTIDINISAHDLNNLEGKFQMLHTTYTDRNVNILSEDFVFTSKREGAIKKLSFESDMLDFTLDGKFNMLDGFKTFRKLAKIYFPNIVKDEIILDKEFKFNGLIKDYSLLEKLVSPGLSFDSGTTVTGSYRSRDNFLDFNAHLLNFRYNNIHIDSTDIKITSLDKKLELKSRLINYAIGANKRNRTIELNAVAFDNKIKGKLNSFGEGPFSSELAFESYIVDHNTYDLKFDNSSFRINNQQWQIADSNRIEYDSTHWTFTNLFVKSAGQELGLNGSVSYNEEEKLTLSLKNFNLESLNAIADSSMLQFEGIVDGNAIVREVYRDVLFESDLEFMDLSFNSKKLGSGNIKSIWDDEQKQLDVSGSLKLNDRKKLDLKGSYMTKAESPLNFDLTLNELPLMVLEPFTDNILSNFDGYGNGVFQLRGKLNDPKLTGLFYLKDASLKVDYTNVTYKILNTDKKGTSVPVIFTPDSISIHDFIASDESGRSAAGSVYFVHNGFTKFDVDLDINPSNMLCLNTNASQNELYYGKAYLSGNIKIQTKLGFTRFKMDVTTENSTVFNLPIDESSEITENKFIVFEVDENVKVNSSKEEEKVTNLELDLKLKSTPGALVRIVFDEVTGDVIEARGIGDLLVKYDPKNNLSMFGDYNIVSGTYVFTLQTIVNKKFDIEAGSTIQWKGDPYAGELNILTSYKTKARLYDIIPEIDPDFNYKRRIPVHLQLKLTETVESPVIGFGVTLPETKENIRGQLQTELSGESCLNQQVFSLLILGSFTPCESNQQNTASTNVGKNTAYEAMSNQLSNWLSKISDDVDIGVSYRPEIQGEEYSPEQVEVALSTQLFNDRLIFDGNLGYGDQQGTSENTRDWAGEFTVEYKIREDGKLRVKAFNKVNDRSYIENDNLYIQGVGLKYSREFGSTKPRSIKKKENKESEEKENQEIKENPLPPSKNEDVIPDEDESL